MYSNTLWEHIKDPQNRGTLEGANAIGQSRYDPCGDHLILQLKVVAGKIGEARFLAKACAPVVGVASFATSQVLGLTSKQARGLSLLQLDQQMGGLPPPKRHALWMFLESLVDALDSIPTETIEELENHEHVWTRSTPIL